jgi:hypothetical protein
MNLNFLGARQMAAFLAITTAGVFVQHKASAQLTLSGNSYVQNFDSLANGLPVGWSVDSGATTSSIGVSSAFTTTATAWNNVSKGFKNVASYDAFIGNPTATAAAQASATNRALGLRQTGTFDSTQAFELTLANTNGLSNFVLDFDLQSLDSSSSRVTTWQVDYGTGTNPNLFTIPQRQLTQVSQPLQAEIHSKRFMCMQILVTA